MTQKRIIYIIKNQEYMLRSQNTNQNASSSKCDFAETNCNILSDTLQSSEYCG